MLFGKSVIFFFWRLCAELEDRFFTFALHTCLSFVLRYLTIGMLKQWVSVILLNGLSVLITLDLHCMCI